MKNLRRFVVLGSFIFFVGCASHEYMTMEASANGEAVTLDPLQDNKVLLERNQPALVGVLNVKEGMVTLGDLTLLSIPVQTLKNTKGELVTIKGTMHGQEVTSTSIQNQELNTQENTGLVLNTERQLHFALPLAQPIDSLLVQLPGNDSPTKLDIRDQLVKLCDGFRYLEACQYAQDKDLNQD